MMRNYHEVDGQPAGRWRLETVVTGPAPLGDPMLNRDTAFMADERRELDLVGLLPSAIITLDEQAKRAYAQYSGSQPTWPRMYS